MRTALLFLCALTAAAFCVITLSISPKSIDPSTITLFQDFHFNLSNGIFFPIWAPQSNLGYGGPDFQFTAPLAHYLLEIPFLSTGDLKFAFQTSYLLLFVVAALGAFKLFEVLLKDVIHFQTKYDFLYCLIAALLFVGSPVFLNLSFNTQFLSQLISLTLFPWLMLSCFTIDRKTIGTTAITIALLALADPVLFVCELALAIMLVFLLWQSPKKWIWFFSSVVLGCLASFFFLGAAFIEKNWIKADALLHSFVAQNTVFFSLKTIAAPSLWIAITGTILTLCLNQTFGSGKKQFRIIAFLTTFSFLFFYLAHSSSEFWHEAFFLKKYGYNPSYSMELGTFFGAMLGGLVCAKFSNKWWKQALAFSAVLALSYATASDKISAFKFHPQVRTLNFIPKDADILPQTPPQDDLEFVKGRGEAKCARPSPVKIECEVMAIQPSILRYNSYDYARWKNYVDENPVEDQSKIKKNGFLVSSVSPGKHFVSWKLQSTLTRTLSRMVSVLVWIALIILLIRSRLSGRSRARTLS